MFVQPASSSAGVCGSADAGVVVAPAAVYAARPHALALDKMTNERYRRLTGSDRFCRTVFRMSDCRTATDVPPPLLDGEGRDSRRPATRQAARSARTVFGQSPDRSSVVVRRRNATSR